MPSAGTKLPATASETFVELLQRRAELHPDRRAFLYLQDGEGEELALTYGELDRQARAIAANLQAIGAAGHRILLLYPPDLGYVAAYFGCLYAGAVAVPAYPPDPSRLSRTLPRLQKIVQDAGATVALTNAFVFGMTEFVFQQAPDLKSLKWIATDQLEDGEESGWKAPTIAPSSTAFLQYTSGSTGDPKGVMVSHKNLMHNSGMICQGFGSGEDTVGVIWLPPYHDMGLIGGLLQPVYLGATAVLMSPIAFLQKPLRWLSAISRFKGTTSGGPNFAYELCIRKSTPEQRKELDLSSWKLAFTGAEQVQADTLDRFSEAFAVSGFKREAFYPCYGLAEGTLIVSGSEKRAPPRVITLDKARLERGAAVEISPGDPNARRVVGCGTTLGGQQIAIVDPQTLQKCEDGKVGEIWVHGPSVTGGYWGRADVTKQAFGATIVGQPPLPWLRTGDLGFMRERDLFISGRIKDLIVIRGHNHYPPDIEAVVERAHPSLRPGSGAAFSIEVSGEEKLVIVQEVERRFIPDRRARNPGSGSDERRSGVKRRLVDQVPAHEPGTGERANFPAIMSVIRQAVSEAHNLEAHAIVLVKPGKIAKTSSGKVQRFAVREAYLAGELEPIADSRTAATVAAPTATPTNGANEAPSSAEAPQAEAALSPTAISPGGTVVTVEGKKRSPEELERWIAVELANALRKNPDEIDPMKPATYYGLDSIVGMSITAELEAFVGRRLSQTVLWELPTIRELAKHLAGGGGGLAPGALGSTPGQSGGFSLRMEGGPTTTAETVAPARPDAEDDEDPEIGYEYPSGGWSFIVGFVLLIFQSILPLRMAQRLLGASSLGGMEVLNNVTRYPALEVMYSYAGGLPAGKGLMLRTLEYVWQHLRNARALRNRLRLVKRELRRSIAAALERKDKINCLSVGAGSARAWLEVLAEMPPHEAARVTLTLLDRDPRALEFGAKRARDSQVKATLQFQEGRAEDMASRYQKGTFDVVEIVGVLDYLRQEEALGLCRLAWHVTAPLGEYITANIRYNPEVPFVKKVIGWPMIYREPDELGSLADVMSDRTAARLVYEPLKIHGVLIGRKRREA